MRLVRIDESLCGGMGVGAMMNWVDGLGWDVGLGVEVGWVGWLGGVCLLLG